MTMGRRVHPALSCHTAKTGVQGCEGASAGCL